MCKGKGRLKRVIVDAAARRDKGGGVCVVGNWGGTLLFLQDNSRPYPPSHDRWEALSLGGVFVIVDAVAKLHRGVRGGLWGWGETLLVGHYPNFPYTSLYTLWPHCHTLPPHRRHTPPPHSGTPPRRRPPGGTGGGPKGPFFGRREKNTLNFRF